MKPRSTPWRGCALLLALCTVARAQATKPTGPERWEKDIAAFEAIDRKNPSPKQGILFVGSSSIRLWKTADAFAGLPVINRGFGGSYISESVHFANRIVLPYEPKTIVFYAGENDVNAGKTPHRVAEDFKEFAGLVHQSLPQTHIVFISLKPSPSRFGKIEQFRLTNRLIREFVATDSRLSFVDVEPAMLGAGGLPREELFVADKLHLNEAGYAIWNRMISEKLAELGWKAR